MPTNQQRSEDSVVYVRLHISPAIAVAEDVVGFDQVRPILRNAVSLAIP